MNKIIECILVGIFLLVFIETILIIIFGTYVGLFVNPMMYEYYGHNRYMMHQFMWLISVAFHIWLLHFMIKIKSQEDK